MRTSSPFAVLLSTFARAETLNWVFANVAWCDHWNSIIRAPCLEELESIAENNPVTILVPNSDAAKKFKQSPEFSSYTNDSICDLVKYHTIVGGYSADAITGAGPFLQTFLGKTNSQDGHSLQVDGDKTDRRGRGINFFSGLRRKASVWYGVCGQLSLPCQCQLIRGRIIPKRMESLCMPSMKCLRHRYRSLIQLMQRASHLP